MGVGDAGVSRSVLHDALAENYELDIADNWDATPGHRGGPEGCMIGNAAGDCGEVRMG